MWERPKQKEREGETVAILAQERAFLKLFVPGFVRLVLVLVLPLHRVCFLVAIA